MNTSVSNAFMATHSEARVTDVLKPVEETVERVLTHYGHETEPSDISQDERDTLRAAQYLQWRLQSFRKTDSCPNCWLTPRHCICTQCTPISHKPSKLNRIFLLMHYKEIMMKVDTAKLIWACYPDTTLVVSGIGSEFQPAMAELEAAIDEKRCLVLFPTDSARPFSEIEQDLSDEAEGGFDVIVMDGTWQQARRMHKRYIASEQDGGPVQAKLSDDAVAMLGRVEVDGQVNSGHQLRQHSVTWRKVGTFEATRLFLRDLAGSDCTDDLAWNDRMEKYQRIANLAVTEGRHGKQSL